MRSFNALRPLCRWLLGLLRVNWPRSLIPRGLALGGDAASRKTEPRVIARPSQAA